MNIYPEQLETIARKRELQSRVLHRKVEEMKASFIKKGIAEEIEPVAQMMEIINDELDLMSNILTELVAAQEVKHG